MRWRRSLGAGIRLIRACVGLTYSLDQSTAFSPWVVLCVGRERERERLGWCDVGVATFPLTVIQGVYS